MGTHRPVDVDKVDKCIMSPDQLHAHTAHTVFRCPVLRGEMHKKVSHHPGHCPAVPVQGGVAQPGQWSHAVIMLSGGS